MAIDKGKSRIAYAVRDFFCGDKVRVCGAEVVKIAPSTYKYINAMRCDCSNTKILGVYSTFTHPGQGVVAVCYARAAVGSIRADDPVTRRSR